MEKLLKWSIEAANSGETGQPIRTAVDGRALEALLTGKDDSQLMKESMSAAQDETLDVEGRVQALDNFLMLIENIDNANNVENMGLWEPLLALLDSDQGTASADPQIRAHTAWIIAACVQNNDKAQRALLKHDGLRVLLSTLEHESAENVQDKVLHALSCELRGNPEALSKFEELNGWKHLVPALRNKQTSRRVSFLFMALLSEPMYSSAVARLISQHGLIPDIASLMTSENEDIAASSLTSLQRLYSLGYINEPDAVTYRSQSRHVRSKFPEIYSSAEWDAYMTSKQ